MSVKDGLTSLNHCCTCSTDAGLQMVNWSAWWTVERHHLTATSKKKARLPGFPRQGRLLSLLKALNKIQLFSEASERSSIKITPQRAFIRILAFHLDLGPSSAPPCLRRFPRLWAAPHSSIANQSMWSPQKPTWLSNVSPLSFIIPSVALHSGRLALICDLYFFHIKPLPPSHFLYIFGLFVVSHSPHRGLLFSLLTLGVILPDSSDTRQHTKSFWLFLFFLFASSSLTRHQFPNSFFFSSVLLYFSCLLLLPSLFSSSLLINIWLWVHWHDTTVPCWSWGCSDLAAEDEEGNTQHFQTFIWALFIWSQNLVVQFPEQPIADFFVLIMSKWARSRRAVANTSIYPTRILGYLGRILADVALAQTFFAEAIK